LPYYSDPETEFHEIVEEAYVDPNLVWDRGKISNQSNGVGNETEYLRHLENSMINFESFLDSDGNSKFVKSQNSIQGLVTSSSPINDTLSDVDLENFEKSEPTGINTNLTTNDVSGGAIFSDFHNISEVVWSIRERLESYLTVNQDESADLENNKSGSKLKESINMFALELERYVNLLNERKESELKKFSENMINQSRVVLMKKAFLRKEKLLTNIYETLSSNYAIPTSESVPDTHHFKDHVRIQGGFTMRNCYGNDYNFETYSDFSSVGYYKMLFNEEKYDNLLNDPPPQQPRKFDDEKISLIFHDPQNVIKQWQNYQFKTNKKKKKKRENFEA
jgi:hypothetical protein